MPGVLLPTRHRPRPSLLGALALLLAALAGLWRAWGPADGGRAAIVAAARDHRGNVLVTLRAPVARVLADDREGSRHQRFLVRVGDRLTVLVAHNLELAPRVPVTAGDTVVVRGEYEWTPQGGVLHWTHDDPAGRHPAGYVERAGRRYQ